MIDLNEKHLYEHKYTDAILAKGRIPGQKVRGYTDEGKPVAVPHVPYEPWIDPAGNVINLPIKTSRVKGGDDSAYEFDIKRRKARRGWTPWNYTPQFHMDSKYGILCSEEEWPTRRLQIVEQKRAEHAKMSAQYNAIWKSKNDQDIARTQEGMTRALEGFLGQVKSTGLGQKKGQPSKDE